MNEERIQSTEKLLGQMSLTTPSSTLDDAVQRIIAPPCSMDSVNPPPSSSWLQVVPAAFIASLVGIIIGIGIGLSIHQNPIPGTVLQTPPLAVDVQKDESSSNTDSSNLVIRETTATPLHGQEARILDDGFVLRDGSYPTRVLRLESRRIPGESNLRVRNTVVLPSREI